MFGLMCLYAVIAIAVFISGFFAGAIHILDKLRKEAVRNGHAEYNNKTGEWKWK